MSYLDLDQIRWKHSFGLARNFVTKTAPPKNFTGLQRGLYDLGRFGTPALGLYAGADYLGMIGDGPNYVAQNMQQAGQAAAGAAPQIRPGLLGGLR